MTVKNNELLDIEHLLFLSSTIALYVPIVPKSRIYSLVGHLSSWHKTAKFTIGSRNGCAEIMWLWQCKTIAARRTKCLIHLFALLSGARINIRCYKLHDKNRWAQKLIFQTIQESYLIHFSLHRRLERWLRVSWITTWSTNFPWRLRCGSIGWDHQSIGDTDEGSD